MRPASLGAWDPNSHHSGSYDTIGDWLSFLVAVEQYLPEAADISTGCPAIRIQHHSQHLNRTDNSCYKQTNINLLFQKTFNLTSEVQNIKNVPFANTPFANCHFPNGGHNCLWAQICLKVFESGAFWRTPLSMFWTSEVRLNTFSTQEINIILS